MLYSISYRCTLFCYFRISWSVRSIFINYRPFDQLWTLFLFQAKVAAVAESSAERTQRIFGHSRAGSSRSCPESIRYIHACRLVSNLDWFEILLFYLILSYLVFSFSGDPDAVERVAYELCETQAKNGVIYFEARFSPHFFSNTEPNSTWHSTGPYKGHGELTPEGALKCVLRGLKRGQHAFGVKSRAILCCISGYPGECCDVCLQIVWIWGWEGLDSSSGEQWSL